MKLKISDLRKIIMEEIKKSFGELSIVDYNSTYDEEIMDLDEVIFGGADASIFEDSEGFVALDEDQRLVGYVLYQKEEDNLHVRSLGVDESLQGSGIGTKLLKKVVEVIDEDGVSATLTIEPNEPNSGQLRSFYGRYGFEDVGKKNPIGNVVLVRKAKNDKSKKAPR